MSTCEIPSPLSQSPGLPKSIEGDPVFAEPWHAQAFALTVHLHDRGLFDWSEWAASLSLEVHKAGRAPDGSDYFDAWIAALTALLDGKGVAEPEQVLALQKSWQRAAQATPHGSPIELANDPLVV
ncbi:nitrile hydratase accessory protein [Rhizobium sp. SL42]|uniref:nitrile hydratase accessory protein n=1 Tax=Rhizobium sp. SL42 TaxID=2806346 RepID=UPI001F016D3F|nr:nitrile hydratase accessory protein [Rhizobium sp. SL42]UJW74076.1 nitrile hydratase accessory protein [Rhizobium sp. SL42]